MFSVVHRRHFSWSCRAFLETLAVLLPVPRQKDIVEKLNSSKHEFLSEYFSSCIRVNTIWRRISTSTLWAPPANMVLSRPRFSTTEVQQHSERMCRSLTEIVRAVPKVRQTFKEGHPKGFLQKTLEEVTVLLFIPRSTVATTRRRRMREFVLVSLTVQSDKFVTYRKSCRHVLHEFTR